MRKDAWFEGKVVREGNVILYPSRCKWRGYGVLPYVAEVRECVEKENACTLQNVMERGRGVLPYVAEAREREGGVEKENDCTLQAVMEWGRGVLL